MKTRFIAIFFCLLSFQLFAHRDKVLVNNYGNIKTYLKTGFDYSEIYKMTIIGKLSNELAAKLQFTDTLLIEYVNDYTKFYTQDIYTFENNNISYKFSEGLEIKSHPINNEKGISLRIYAKSVDIESVLKLVEFSIINRKTLKSKLITQKVMSKYPEELPSGGISINLIPIDLFKKITSKKSDIVDEILHNRIEIQLDSPIQIVWENNKFTFEYKNPEESKYILFEIKDFYYLKEVDLKTMLVFIDEQSFYYLTIDEKTGEKLFKLDFKSYKPVDVNNKFAGKIILSNEYGFNIFLKHKRKLITNNE